MAESEKAITLADVIEAVEERVYEVTIDAHGRMVPTDETDDMKQVRTLLYALRARLEAMEGDFCESADWTDGYVTALRAILGETEPTHA